jgi:protein-S-isoprenylcysteine O-methyltransferase Ste14
VRRIGFEDAFLRRNLAGYSDYAARVRHRVLPGVW